MKRNTMLKILNPILGCLLVNQILTGMFREVIPYDAFEIMHEAAGYALAVAAVLHVLLNWNWVKANFFKTSPPIKS